MGDDDIGRDVSEILASLGTRSHAFLGQAPRRFRELAERSVVQDWANTQYGETIRTIDSGDDPPDCIVTVWLGDSGTFKELSIEVTELVCEKAIKDAPNYENVSLDWPEARFIDHVQKLIDKKSKNYEKRNIRIDVLLVHSDELTLDPETVSSAMKSHCFKWGSALSEVHFMKDYVPFTDLKPVWILKRS